jgi:hypothetical protein
MASACVIIVPVEETLFMNAGDTFGEHSTGRHPMHSRLPLFLAVLFLAGALGS